MSDSENSSSGSNFLANFINGGIDSFYNYVDSWTGDFFNKRSEKRAYERALRMLENNYAYAKRYAENSPKWAVDGLRAAGLNPILAAGGGVHVGTAPSAPSVTPTSVGRGNRSGRYWDPLLNRQISLLDEQIKGQKIKNKNEEMNRGLTGQYGAYSRLLSEAQNGLSARPSNHNNVMDIISDALNRFDSFLKSTPRSKSSSDSHRSDGTSSDTPPEMNKWQKYIISDGFDSRNWSRSSHKYDGQYRYERRQWWKSVFTR